MLQFAQPLWLWASSAILVPILIHLWNLQSGKTLKVGSIMLISESQKQNIRSRVITETPLLILRCLLIICLALLLAQPQWKSANDPSTKAGWILIQKENGLNAYKSYQPQVDSLLSAGFELRLLDSSFAHIDLKSIAQDTAGSDDYSNTTSVWQLISLLDQKLHAGFPVYVFSTSQLRMFEGRRPTVSIDLKWKTYVSKDSIANRLVKIRKTSDDSLRIFTINNTPAGNKVAFASYAADQLNSIKAQYREDSSHLLTDTATLTVSVYADKGEPGLSYLQSAIKAISTFGKYRVRLSVADRVEDLRKNEDWLFWLSTKPPATDAKNVVTYSDGKQKSIESWLMTDNAAILSEPVILNRYIEAPAANDELVIWKDGFGHPILTRKAGVSNYYRLHTKLDPAWTGLVWNDRFPLVLMNLLMEPKQELTNAKDLRSVDESLISPAVVNNTTKLVSDGASESIPLARYFWILAFILFAAERFISSRKKTAHV